MRWLATTILLLVAACTGDADSSESSVALADPSACPQADTRAGLRAALCNGNNAVSLLGGLVWSSVDRGRRNPASDALPWTAGLGVGLGLPYLVVADEGRRVTYVAEDGEPFTYTAIENGYRRPPDGPGRLERTRAGYLFTLAGTGRIEFSSCAGAVCFLSAEESLEGDRIEYRRERDGRPLELTGPDERVLFLWEGNRLRTLYSSIPGNRLELDYDAFDRLLSLVSFQSGVVAERLTLAYEPLADGTAVVTESRLVAAGQPELFERRVRFRYGAGGRLAAVLGPDDGAVLTLQRTAFDGHRGTVAIHRTGLGGEPALETRSFDAGGRLLEIRTAAGGPDRAHTYDAQGYLARMTTRDQGNVVIDVDAAGLVARIAREGTGGRSETRFENARGLRVGATTELPDGTTVVSRYDGTTGAVRETTRGGWVTEHDAAGRPLRLSYRGQSVREWEYDRLGERRFVIEQDFTERVPHLRLLRYDAEGRVRPVEDDWTSVLGGV